jgi:hypothetical protein
MVVTNLLGDAHPSRSQRGPRDSRRLGRDLDRISRGLNAKIPIHIQEGLKRPEAPIQAAEFASKGEIIVHGHIPILPSWKDYKPKKNQQDGEKTEDHLKNYMGKLAVCICPLIYYHSSLCHPFF